MTKIIRNILVTMIAAFALVTPLAMVPSVAANEFDLQGNLCSGTDGQLLSSSGDDCVNDSAAGDTVNETVTLALNLFSAIVGIIAVVMIIIGGVKYITSGGESSNVTTAKNTILYAVIGLVIVALAQIIVRFVLERFTSGS